jgi:pyridoxal phosphate enzyme (YggS family)
METENQFLINLDQLRLRITNACNTAGRSPDEVELMAVTKTHPVSALQMALRAGLRRIGENRVQEAVDKRSSMDRGAGSLELIGPLQTNKARIAIQTFDRIQTVDRTKLANRLDRICEEEGKEALPVLMQVNVGEDPAKAGCSRHEAERLAAAILSSNHLRLEGLMTIGEFSDEEAVVRATFERLRTLRDELEPALGIRLPVLSMGMSHDLEWAIAEGSTLIRVGTALFGQRETAHQPS